LPGRDWNYLYNSIEVRNFPNYENKSFIFAMPENTLAAAVEWDLHKAPYWYEDPGRDSFTAENWVQRGERIRMATQWNDETTASHALNSLRGRALFLHHHEIHYPAIKTSWTMLKKHFTRIYGVVRKDTSKISNFNIVQAAHKDVDLYSFWVTMTVKEFYCGLPEVRDDPHPGWIGIH